MATSKPSCGSDLATNGSADPGILLTAPLQLGSGFMTDAEALLALLVAGALGFVVGLERQLSRHGDDGYVGARTFALYGMWGAACGFLGDRFGIAATASGLVAFAVLLIASYWASTTISEDWGTTTEAAALLVFVAGLLAWDGRWVTAIGITVVVTALLRAKGALHQLGSQFSDEDVRTFLQFAVVTAVILPLVPDEALGRFDGFNPREIWLMVVFVSAIGLAGYVALRLLGSRGLAVTGLLGGLVSSTAVTVSFSRMARLSTQPSPALATGMLAACGLMYLRVLVEAVVLAPPLAARLAPWLLAAFALIAALAVFWWTRPTSGPPDNSELKLRNPLALSVALAFSAIYALVAFTSRAAIELLNQDSLSLVGALSGLNDVDAITLSMGNLVRSGLAVNPAAQAVLAAVSVNTAVKAGLAIALGGAIHARKVAPALGVATMLTAVAWAII